MTVSFDETLVIIPAFNEEETVGLVVGEVFSACPGISVLVVDDGSIDRTREVASNAGAIVASLPFNLGVGGAMRTGFRFAVEKGFVAAVQVDADGQHDPQEVASLLDALSQADLVLGARFAGVGNYRVSGPRSWAMKSLARVLSRVTNTKLTDTTSGFRASGPRALKLFAQQYPVEYLGDTVEALVIAARNGLKVEQIPVAMRPRMGGVPSQNPGMAAIYLGRAWLALIFALIRPKVKRTS